MILSMPISEMVYPTMSKYLMDDHLQLQLELCAFALKGEHNVYSLVPNIPVCIYIDQK